MLCLATLLTVAVASPASFDNRVEGVPRFFSCVLDVVSLQNVPWISKKHGSISSHLESSISSHPSRVISHLSLQLRSHVRVSRVRSLFVPLHQVLVPPGGHQQGCVCGPPAIPLVHPEGEVVTFWWDLQQPSCNTLLDDTILLCYPPEEIGTGGKNR